MPADRDPFEGLSLDEGFIRAARFIEPPARDRRPGGDGKRGAPCQVSPAHRGLPGFFHRLVSPPKPAPLRRRAARFVAAIALCVGMVSLAMVLLRQNAVRNQSSAEPAPVRAGPPVEVTASATVSTPLSTPQATATATSARQTAPGVVVPASVVAKLSPGTCLTWPADGPNGANGAVPTGVHVVGCQEEHRAEVTSVADLAKQFPAWPGGDALDSVVRDSCPSMLDDFADVDPPGLLPRPGGAYPGQAEWSGSSRILACLAVDQLSRSWSGSVRAADRVT